MTPQPSISSEEPTPEARMIDHVLADAREKNDGYEHDGWYAFPQVHSDGSLGFGGMAGQMVTTAQTIIVLGETKALIYFGGRFGYAETRYIGVEYARELRAPTVLQRRRRLPNV